MKKLKKISKYIVLLGVSVFLLAGCGEKSDQSKDQSETLKTVQIAISNEGKADKLDATSYDAAMPLYSAVYEPLVNYGEKGSFEPGLAESWEISEDGKLYTFHLKKNVKFSDGSDFNGKAVKFTIERAKALNKETTLQTLANLEKIELPDDYTVTLSFTKLSNQVLGELCQVRPLRMMSPNSVAKQAIDGKFEQAIGTGPFVIEKTSGERTTMTPNKYYNNETPLQYQLAFQTISDGSARTSALRSGEVDIAGGTLGSIATEDIATLKKDKNFQIHQFEGTMSHFLGFNPENKVLQNANVRKALALMTNKKELSTKEMKGLFQPTVQYVTESNQPEVSYDTAEAAKLLESEGFKKNNAGYYENENGQLSLDLVIQTTEYPEWKKKAEIIESEWKKSGVQVKIKTLDMESYYDTLWSTKKYDVIFYRTYTDALLPYYFLTSLFYNVDGKAGVLANDSTLTTDLNTYAELIEADQRQKQFDQIFARISEESLAIPIAYIDEEFVTSKKIKTFGYSGLSDAPIAYQDLVVD